MIIPPHDYTARERTVCEILSETSGIRTLLNIGMRRPEDPRNWWWLKICQANRIEPHVLEIFEPNCRRLREAGLKNVTCGDVCEIGRLYERSFDAILWWHGPEHLEKTQSRAAIDQLRRLTNTLLILGCPLGDAPQGAVDGNVHEIHRSAWQAEEFAALGMRTRIVHDEQPHAHITAWQQIGAQASPDGENRDVANDSVGIPTADSNITAVVRKLALIFDDQTRPETTGVYCRRALQTLAPEIDVTFFPPAQLAEVPRTGFDLYLNVDDGLGYPLPEELRPCAWWCIDAHVDFDRSLSKARQFDFVFAAQRDGAALLRREGVSWCRWLPLACDPEVHGKHDVPKRYDVCFVGNLFPGPRTDLVRLIQQYFPNSFVGQAYFEEMAKTYSASRIVFNRSLANDINMRVFEALASGSLLVTNDLADNGQAELFRDGVHLATYRDGDELLDKLRFYLRREELREIIADAGRQEVLAKHTYAHRMRHLLSAVATELGACSLGRPKEATVASGQQENATVGQEQVRVASDSSFEGQIGPFAVGQDRTYFEFARPEILALVPTSARRVLEIGCGTGRLGESLKARQTCEVVGIELDVDAATAALQRLDRVLIGDVEELKPEFDEGSFDCVVCGDVLEHLYDPQRLLERLRHWLHPDGVLIASIPNVRHQSVVRSLLAGNFTYEPAGLLDETHLHFFTRRDMARLFERAGYQITDWKIVPGPDYDEWKRAGRPGKVQLGGLCMDGLAREEAEEFFVYQYLITASVAPAAVAEAAATGPTELAAADRVVSDCTKAVAKPECGSAAATPLHDVTATAGPWPPCLLLMVTYNRLEYTRLALDAVLALDYPGTLNVVVWDNASTDGTVEYVRERIEHVPHARLIASPENRGVVFPMNAVWWSDASAELLAKVDNDTLVPPDWLRRLAACHLQSTQFGVLSGFHFRTEGEGLVDDSRLLSIDGVRVLPQPYVGGCAVVVRKAVLDRLGPIPCQAHSEGTPFMDSSWTYYQQQIDACRLVNGYPWPPIHVDHMEDIRSAHCIRSAEHEQYKQALRGMSLAEFTRELCVWRPSWMPQTHSNGRPEAEPSKATEPGDRPTPPAGQSGDEASAVLQENEHGETTTRVGPADVSASSRTTCRMRFTQDFRRDFEQFDFWGPPFAFVRFADGERAICMGQAIQGQDGWSYRGGESRFQDDLMAALQYSAPDYYIGISDACCDREAHEWYLQQIKVPLCQVTFSNIFVNGNYGRFRRLDVSDMAIVASHGGDYWVPEDAMNCEFDLDRLVERLLGVDRPILVSAGPASCIIIHRYWQRAAARKKQTIVDVGSAIDETTKRRKTRQYQCAGTRTAELVCTW